MKNIVSQEWLVKNLSKDNLVLLDARGDLNDPNIGFTEYKEGHIQGAQYVSLEEIMTGTLGTHGGRHPLPDMNEFVENMKKLGMQDDSIVVIYDHGNLAIAGRLWWLLKYMGKKDVFILAGGFNHWVDQDLEVTTEIETPKISNSLSLNLNPAIEVDMSYVKSVMHDPDVAIVDARTPERYAGEVEPVDKVPGHIPNAMNYPWTNLVKDGKILSEEEIQAYFESLKDFDEVIVHCGSGITGTVNILLMEEMGLQPKLYVGGYSDWISYEENDIVTKDPTK